MSLRPARAVASRNLCQPHTGRSVGLNIRVAMYIRQTSDKDGIPLTSKSAVDPVKLRKETREWLASHTLEDVREIATSLENAGEDVTDLWKAIDDLSSIVNEEPTGAGHRTHAKAHA